jgi:hypothetical protein
MHNHQHKIAITKSMSSWRILTTKDVVLLPQVELQLLDCMAPTT